MALENDTVFNTAPILNTTGIVNLSLYLEFVNGSTQEDMNKAKQEMETPSAVMLNVLTVLFCVIGIVGICGNVLVICVILLDRKMRQSVTNIFIMNLAIADFLIMAFGIPEIILFRLNNGWTFGFTWCKINRYILVVSLYTSVLSLLSVCVER